MLVRCSFCKKEISAEFRYCGYCGSAIEPSDTKSRSKTIFETSTGRVSERRQLTVLFADLVDSTKLAEKLDSEDLSDLLNDYQEIAKNKVTDHIGYLAQFLGDGVLAYFGYPKADEVDAERAVDAGLDIIETLSNYNIKNKTNLRVRIGIATGQVVIKDAINLSPTPLLSVAGNTLNLAARLQTLALPNSIVVSSQTKNIVGRLYEYEFLGSQRLKGFSEPIDAFGIKSKKSYQARFDASGVGSRTPLVGRVEENELLYEKWELTQAGLGQVVTIEGEAGIGKSRLVHNLRLKFNIVDITLLRYQCSPHYSNTALYPVFAQLEQFAGFKLEDSEKVKFDKLSDLVSKEIHLDDKVKRDFLKVILEFQQISQEISSDRKKWRDQSLLIISTIVKSLTQRKPTLIIFEDLQWIDPTSAELLTRIVAWSSSEKLMLILTSREGFSSVIPSNMKSTTLTLNRLDSSQSVALVKKIDGGALLDQKMINEIVIKSSGIPLFLEELTKSVIETSEDSPRDHSSSNTGNEIVLNIPNSLQDILMARLDRLDDIKEIAQICSVMGREFLFEVVDRLLDVDTDVIRFGFQKLMDAEIIFRRNVPTEIYIFKHALIQDAAYESMLHSKRRSLHDHIATILLEDFPQYSSSNPELVAWHWTSAGNLKNAIEYWKISGRKAADRSANAESVNHFEKALELSSALSTTPEIQKNQLEVRIMLGPALINTQGALSSRVKKNYHEARILCDILEVSTDQFAALWGNWRITTNYFDKLPICEELLRISKELNDKGLELQAHHTLWATHFHLGHHDRCLDHIDKGLSIYEQGDYKAHANLFGGHDPKVCALGEASFSLWLMGDFDNSKSKINQAEHWAKELNHSGTLAHYLEMSLLLFGYYRDAKLILERANQFVDFAEHEEFPIHKAKGLIFKGWAKALMGIPKEGLEQIRQGLKEQETTGSREDYPIFFRMLAETLFMLEEFKEAGSVIDKAIYEFALTGLSYWTPELYRFKGELLRSENALTDAENYFQRSIQLSRKQSAKNLELKASISLAKLWSDEARYNEAVGILHPIFSAFDLNSSNSDLDEAASLLRSLTN